MRPWISGTARATFLTAGFVALGAAIVPAGALADTSGEHGVLAGNRHNAPVSAPVNISGNSVGDAKPQSPGGADDHHPHATPERAAWPGASRHRTQDCAPHQQASGERGVLSGNRALAPIGASVDACGNAGAVAGLAGVGCAGGAAVRNSDDGKYRKRTAARNAPAVALPALRGLSAVSGHAATPPTGSGEQGAMPVPALLDDDPGLSPDRPDVPVEELPFTSWLVDTAQRQEATAIAHPPLLARDKTPRPELPPLDDSVLPYTTPIPALLDTPGRTAPDRRANPVPGVDVPLPKVFPLSAVGLRRADGVAANKRADPVPGVDVPLPKVFPLSAVGLRRAGLASNERTGPVPGVDVPLPRVFPLSAVGLRRASVASNERMGPVPGVDVPLPEVFPLSAVGLRRAEGVAGAANERAAASSLRRSEGGVLPDRVGGLVFASGRELPVSGPGVPLYVVEEVVVPSAGVVSQGRGDGLPSFGTGRVAVFDAGSLPLGVQRTMPGLGGPASHTRAASGGAAGVPDAAPRGGRLDAVRVAAAEPLEVAERGTAWALVAVAAMGVLSVASGLVRRRFSRR
ncbi:chaplin family protein [Actinomadura flavalba]|uniref:chaplin family protein n=1 Tax=Actinomadura flavalba TaxID=1120938 RepID=UPI000379148F|nr:chaplin family protein [Actinomadura flavalba]